MVEMIYKSVIKDGEKYETLGSKSTVLLQGQGWMPSNSYGRTK